MKNKILKIILIIVITLAVLIYLIFSFVNKRNTIKDVLNGQYQIVSMITDGQSEIIDGDEIINFKKDGSWERSGVGGNWRGNYFIQDGQIVFSDYEDDQGQKQDQSLQGQLQLDGKDLIITYGQQAFWTQRIVVYEKL
ncbi:MAG TPA: hypothetical protein VGA49_01700 [Patescibacteria group bacterium]